MESFGAKIVTFIFSVFLLAYVGYQSFQHVSSSVKTERVISYQVQDVEKVRGLIVREESVITQQSAGVVSYYNDDGVKVTYGSPLAEVYATKEDVLNRRRVKDLELELEQLNAIERPGNNYYLNSDSISKQINENLFAIIRQNESGNLLDVDLQKAELLNNLNKKQLATGVVDNFSSKGSRLSAEMEQLRGSISGTASVIESDRVGYFSSFVDGMEGTITPETAASFDVEQIEEYLDAKYEQDDSKIGKIISQKPWNFMIVKNKNEAELLYEGMQLSIDFGIPNYGNVPASIESIREEAGSSQVIITMSCNYICPQLTRMRNPTVELNYNAYKGLKIPNQAVRFKENVRGVYVDTGSEIVFKKLDVIYEGQGFVLSSIDRLDETLVQPNEDIVVSGVIPEKQLSQPVSSSDDEASSNSASGAASASEPAESQSAASSQAASASDSSSRLTAASATGDSSRKTE